MKLKIRELKVILCFACLTHAAAPNIVYILTDDLGIGDVSGYNPPSKNPTPEMDKLIGEGLRFSDAHSNSSVCSPTRYGVLTGRYAWRTVMKSGVLNGSSPALIEPGRLSVANVLRAKGYATAMIGKWHLGLFDSMNTDWTKPFTKGPLVNGFDYCFGLAASLDMPPYALFEGNRFSPPPTDTIAASPWPLFWRAGALAPGFTHMNALPMITDKAVEYLKKQKSLASGNPFFLYLTLPSPHTPHITTPAFAGVSQNGARGDLVMETDWAVGRIVHALDSLGLKNNTLLILTSDNGAHDKDYVKNGHTPHMGWRGEKADIFEAGHRVPFIARWPGVIASGSKSDQVICLTDFMATAAAIAGYALPENAGEDSYSLLPIFLGKSVTSALREATVHHSGDGVFAIRQGNWKLTVDNLGSGGFTVPQNTPGIGTLYNLSNNPAEKPELDQYAQQATVVANLRALLKKYQSDGRSTPKIRKDEFYSGSTEISMRPMAAKMTIARPNGKLVRSWDLNGAIQRFSQGFLH
jgi:arylsulfatase A